MKAQLRRLALRLFGCWARYYPYANPAAVGYDMAVSLPIIGTVAFRPVSAPDAQQSEPLIFTW